MAHKKKHAGPIPAANQPHAGPPEKGVEMEESAGGLQHGQPLQDQDPKRRLGDFEGKGEHSFQQPGGKNDANH